MSKFVFLILIVLISTTSVFACKDFKEFEAYPINQTLNFSHVLEIKINKVEYSVPRESVRYTPPFKFTGSVVKSFKGLLKSGTSIYGLTSINEQAHAVCPVNLEEGKTYLVILNQEGENFIISRYRTLVVPSTHRRYKQYLKELNDKFK